MKAVLEFSLPEERTRFETAALAETWQLLLNGLIKDLTDLCATANVGHPTLRQIQWLLNHVEMKLRELKIDSRGALAPNDLDSATRPACLAGISSVVLTFGETEDWLNRPNRKYGMGKPINVICACGSMGAKLVMQDLAKMEAEREAIRPSANLASTGRSVSPALP